MEVDDYELNQLVLQGRNLEFCDLPAPIQDLIFYRFDVFSKRRFSLPVRQDLLATLGCCNNAEGYTVTAELISDQNPLPGISVVQFGQSISQILNRKRFENESILELNEGVLNMAVDLLTYEEIDGIYRELKTKVPASAQGNHYQRSHSSRLVSAQPVQIELFSDKMTVLSPGGLPNSMTVEEYLNSGRSIPRNTQLTILFFRLNLIEKTWNRSAKSPCSVSGRAGPAGIQSLSELDPGDSALSGSESKESAE